MTGASASGSRRVFARGTTASGGDRARPTTRFNTDNSVAAFLSDTAEQVNVLGDLKTFEPDGRGKEARDSAQTKTVLVNGGICAIFYLVVGKIAERLIRP